MIAVSDEVLDAVVERHLVVLGKTGSGKTYAAKGIVERLIRHRRRVCIIDPTGVWWGLKATPEGAASQLPVAVLGGDHADLALSESLGEAAAAAAVQLPLVLVLDLSLMTHSARTRFLTDFLAALFRLNRDVLHLVLDEADEAAPQNPLPETRRLFGEVDRIVRRGRAKGFRVIAITQRPAALHKHVLSQADTLIALKLVAPQDRKAVEDWIRGQADVDAGREVLDSLAKLKPGVGWIWAPEQGVLSRIRFPAIATYDSGRTPDGVAMPAITTASVDLAALAATLESIQPADSRSIAESRRDRGHVAELQSALDQAAVRIAALERDLEAVRLSERRLKDRLAQVARLAQLDGTTELVTKTHTASSSSPNLLRDAADQPSRERRPGVLHPAARKLLAVLAQHAPDRFTWGQAATLAGLKPSGGHFNAGRKQLRDRGLIDERDGWIAVTDVGFAEAGEQVPAPSTPAERLELWCGRLPSPAPQMLRYLATQGIRFVDADELAGVLGKKPSGGHWNSGIATLRNNGLIEADGRRYRAAELLRPAAGQAARAVVIGTE